MTLDEVARRADDEECTAVEAQVEFGLDAAVVHVPFGEPVAEEHDALTLGGIRHALRTRGGGGGRQREIRVRAHDGLFRRSLLGGGLAALALAQIGRAHV